MFGDLWNFVLVAVNTILHRSNDGILSAQSEIGFQHQVLQSFHEEYVQYSQKGRDRTGCVIRMLDGTGLDKKEMEDFLMAADLSYGISAVFRSDSRLTCAGCQEYSHVKRRISRGIYYRGTPCSNQYAVEQFGPQRVVLISDSPLSKSVIAEQRFVLEMNGFEEWKRADDAYPVWPNDMRAYYTQIDEVKIPQLLHFMPYIDIIGMADSTIVTLSLDFDIGNVVSGMTNKPVTVLSTSMYSETGGHHGTYAMLDYCNVGVSVVGQGNFTKPVLTLLSTWIH